MTANRLLRHMLVLVLTHGFTDVSFAFELAELQRLLQAAPPKPVAFSEVRESPWLEQPVESRGFLESRPGVLEKRVVAPRQEVWRMLPDRLDYRAAGDTAGKQVLFSQAPAVAALADTLRRVVAGELQALERDFRISLKGSEHAWTVHLQPLGGDAARYLDHLELEGAGAALLVISVVDRHGERTTTRLFP